MANDEMGENQNQPIRFQFSDLFVTSVWQLPIKLPWLGG